jgi:8-oxo-dGTP diphosphatase
MADRHLTRTAVFVILERGDKVFLLRRQNTGWADGMLTLPSGHVDKGDMVREAAIKEVKEEAGVDVSPEDLEFVHVDYVRDVYINFYFRATKWKGEPKLGEPHLASEVMWADINHLPDDIIMQLKNMFEHCKNQVYFSEIEDEV